MLTMKAIGTFRAAKKCSTLHIKSIDKSRDLPCARARRARFTSMSCRPPRGGRGLKLLQSFARSSRAARRPPRGGRGLKSRGGIRYTATISHLRHCELGASRRRQLSGTSEVKHPNKPRLTFAKSKDERGEDAYRFVGVFQYTKNTAEGHHVYSRVCDKSDLSI